MEICKECNKEFTELKYLSAHLREQHFTEILTDHSLPLFNSLNKAIHNYLSEKKEELTLAVSEDNRKKKKNSKVNTSKINRLNPETSKIDQYYSSTNQNQYLHAFLHRDNNSNANANESVELDQYRYDKSQIVTPIAATYTGNNSQASTATNDAALQTIQAVLLIEFIQYEFNHHRIASESLLSHAKLFWTIFNGPTALYDKTAKAFSEVALHTIGGTHGNIALKRGKRDTRTTNFTDAAVYLTEVGLPKPMKATQKRCKRWVANMLGEYYGRRHSDFDEHNGRCLVCEKPTKYFGMGKKFAKTCSHECASRLGSWREKHKFKESSHYRYHCDVCKNAFKLKKDWIYHYITFHPSKIDAMRGPKHVCRICKVGTPVKNLDYEQGRVAIEFFGTCENHRNYEVLIMDAR